jgi:hypothetical protein
VTTADPTSSDTAAADAASSDNLASTGTTHNLTWMLVGGAALAYVGYLVLAAGSRRGHRRRRA